jgi:carboxyl-terminal processing protease
MRGVAYVRHLFGRARSVGPYSGNMLIKTLSALLVLTLIGPSFRFLGQEKSLGKAAPVQGSGPFRVEIGSSFEASSAVRVGSSAKITKDTLSADIEEALAIVRGNHVARPGVDLTGAAVTGMLKALDPHSSYYDPAAFQQMLDEHAAEFTGTGSTIAGFERRGRIETFVLSTMPGSPAAAAGLGFGDRLIDIDGQDVRGMAPDEIGNLMRGRPGSRVRLTVERPGSHEFHTITITRRRLHEPAVPAGMILNGNIGYLDVTSGFSSATFTELDRSLADLKRRGARSLILDLRGNTGGLLEQAIKAAEIFLPPGSIIVSQKGRYANEERTWRAASHRYENMPLVLLVDGGSASATEVLAGALQDNDRALIIGSKTFGKGLVQNVLRLPGGAGLTLTAARYFTPTGRSIQREYEEVGLYDYYRHRTQEAGIGKAAYAARTITNRVVHGGDGITPDEAANEELMTPARRRLLDPIFHFAREYGLPPSHSSSALSERSVVPDAAMSGQFAQFLAGDEEWRNLVSIAAAENDFVREMLAHYLTMKALGPEAARSFQVRFDKAVAQAVAAMPRAGKLAADAAKARAKKEKSPMSLVLNGPR